MDSLRVMRLENRAFLRLQPWKSDGIVSRLDVGIGDKLLNYYTFNPAGYIQGSSNVVLNSAYLYAGANGKFKKYIQWDAMGQYTFLGHEINDFDISANLSLSVYPFRRDRKSPLTFNAHFETNLKEPDYYQQHLLSISHLPEIDVERYGDTQDDYCMYNIPLVPACPCRSLLLRSSRTEYKSLYLFRSRSLCKKADYNDDDYAEKEHPSAEEEPVDIIEDVLEEIV